ncbi:DmsC/YnfH family molybdoenzyme membrane anchor subunit [Klebsiella quasipneumoniae]|uniref:DmsC/YnfH family molybdoenzyme membrane anchor subunit n=1 Tax=Klebsiella quasipneumoniae TaxID=1463165 RepID=UPI003006F000
MGSGWHEWPLVLFTVLGQCVVGATLISGLVWLELADQREARQRLVRSMFFIWLLMGIGFLASVMHLGSPLRAFNSLNRVGASALSNEIASGALFFAVGGFWWLLAVLEKMPAALGKIWLVIALLLGLLFILAMTRVYQIDTVPTWYTGYTTSAFFLTVLLSGPLFAALLLQMAKVDVNGWFIAGLSMAALVISAAVIVMQSTGLSTIHSSVQQAASLLPNYGRLQALRLILLALGLGCWLCPLIRRQPPRAVGLLAGLVLVLIAECIGRGLFYELHMTVGMAVAG